MAARDTVLDNFKTALEGITAANGYHTTVKKVNRGPMPYDAIQNDCPFIAIIEGDETKLVKDETNIKFSLSVILICFIRGYTSSGMSDSIDKFIDDIKKLVCSPVDLGSYCFAVNIDEISAPDISDTENMGSAGIALEVIYYAPQSTF